MLLLGGDDGEPLFGHGTVPGLYPDTAGATENR